MNPYAALFSEERIIGRTFLGRYRIIQRLGRGGMGVVYLASVKGAAGFVKPVVVKLMLPGLVSNQKFSSMFIREAKILARLKDPAIVDVIDFAEEDGFSIMVLEYVNGHQLRQWLQYLKHKERRIPTNVSIQIVIAVCDALHYAHNLKGLDSTAMQVIHRDVSTPNILLDTEGHIKLVDFGIARITGTIQEYHTEEDTFKGKYPYTAPEIFSGSEASVQSDVYSCGVVLHEILTGDNIFAAVDPAETLWRVMNLTPSSVHGYREDAPDDIDAIIGKAMAKAPDERYQTAQELALALRKSNTSSEREALETLREQVRADFGEEMANYLGVDSLQQLEKAWRNPSLYPLRHSEVEISTDSLTSDITPLAPETETALDVDTVVTEDAKVEQMVDSEPAAGRAETPGAGGGVEPSPAVAPAVPAQASAVRTGSASRFAGRLLWVAAAGLLIGMGALIAVKGGKTDRESRQYLLVQSPTEASGPAVPVSETPEQKRSDQETAAKESKEPSANEKAEPNPLVAPRPAAKTAAEKPSAAKAGVPDVKLLTRTFRRREADIQRCFQKHAVKFSGKPEIVVHFQVDASGRVVSAAISPPELAATALGKCVQSVAKSTRFPRQTETISFRIPVTAQRIQ